MRKWNLNFAFNKHLPSWYISWSLNQVSRWVMPTSAKKLCLVSNETRQPWTNKQLNGKVKLSVIFLNPWIHVSEYIVTLFTQLIWGAIFKSLVTFVTPTYLAQWEVAKNGILRPMNIVGNWSSLDLLVLADTELRQFSVKTSLSSWS